MIFITEPFLPPYSDYERCLKDIWKRNWLTTHGFLVQELMKKLRGYLGVSTLYTRKCFYPSLYLLSFLKMKGYPVSN